MASPDAPLTRHLEVETYTWSVLPPQYRGAAMDHAIARELSWLREHLGS